MKKKENVKDLILTLLELMGFDKDACRVEPGADDKGMIIKTDSQDAGILIGRNGETLQALQLIVNLIHGRREGEWGKINLDVGDYWQRRRQFLEELSREVADRVAASGQPEALTPLSSNERRMVHEALAESKAVTTVSEGAGRERRLIVKPI